LDFLSVEEEELGDSGRDQLFQEVFPLVFVQVGGELPVPTYFEVLDDAFPTVTPGSFYAVVVHLAHVGVLKFEADRGFISGVLGVLVKLSSDVLLVICFADPSS